jgi:hypothetical protein
MLRSRLALRRGLSLDQFAEQTTAAEFRHWKDFNQIDPVGDVRIDRLMTMLCRLIAQSNSIHPISEDAYEVTWSKQAEALSPEAIAEEQEQTKQAFRAKLAKVATK